MTSSATIAAPMFVANDDDGGGGAGERVTLKFPDISANNSVSGSLRMVPRQRLTKGLSAWFPGAETLDIMPIIEEMEEPRERANENGVGPRSKYKGKSRRRSSGSKPRARETLPCRRGSLTPVRRPSASAQTCVESASAPASTSTSAKLDRRPIPKIKPTAAKAAVDTFDFDKFVRSLDKISLPKVAPSDRPTSSSSLISRYSGASSGNNSNGSGSSSYARSDASTVTLRDIDAAATATLEPEDSISRRGYPDTSVLDLDDDDMADFADELAAPYAAAPLRFGATLSKEASMAMLMEYEDVVKTSIHIRSVDVVGSATFAPSSSTSTSTPSARRNQSSAPCRGSPLPSGAVSPEDVFYNQRQVNRKMQKAMTLLDRVKQIEQESVTRKSPVASSCYTSGRISPQSKWGRYW